MHTATVIFAFAALTAGALADNLGPHPVPARRPTPSPKELADARAEHLAAHEQVTSAHLQALAAARAYRAKSGPVDLDGPSPQDGGRRANRLSTGEYIPGAAYKSAYAVSSKLTGDRKSAAVVHEGDVTKGSYSVVDPDGVTRTVNYVVTPLGGFQAQVLRDGVPVVVGADAGYIGDAPKGVPRVNHGGNQGRPQGAPRPAPAPQPRPQQGQWQAPAQPQWQQPAPVQWQQPAPAQWQQPAQVWRQPAPAQDWQGQQRWQQPSQVTWTREVDPDNERERAEHLAEHARVTAERLQALSQANARAVADDEYGLIDAKLYG